MSALELPEVVRRGAELVQARRFAEAVSLLEPLRGRTDAPEALVLLGEALLSLERWAEGLAIVDAFLALEPASTWAMRLRCVALENLGRFDEQLATAREVLRLEPENANAHFLAAKGLWQGNRDVEARAALEQAIHLEPDVPLYRFTLSKFVFQSSPDEARALLERVVAEQPDNAQALNNLGALLVRAGDLAQARALFVRARDLDGAFVMARANLSRVRARERSLVAHLVRGLVIAVFLTIPVAVACAFLLATEHPVAAGAVGGLGGAAELLVLAGYGFAAHQRRTDAPEWVP